MSDRLPNELSSEIIEIASSLFVAKHRATVVALAQASKQTYSLVAPILYRFMLITPKNWGAARAFLYSDETELLAKRVCAHVRVLCVWAEKDVYNSTRFSFFTALQSYYGPTDVLVMLSNIAHPNNLRRITLRASEPFTCMATLKQVSQVVKDHITHLTLSCVAPYSLFRLELAAWCRKTFDSFPALTHFGMSITGDINNFYNFSTKSMALRSLEQTLRAALSYSHISCVAVHLSGLFCSLFTDIQRALHSLRQDQRLQIWTDDRPVSEDLVPYWKIMADDVRRGRDVWAECRCNGSP
ncbi:hypothetical protein BKA62DRAFT_721441 [Auriculariales sp. MPI-PUGE-AT-0066]|nr:hypothetical protein BKA62DRAFT_721441 [Auriculariales sp. MPI-PUGE-AT-0066]